MTALEAFLANISGEQFARDLIATDPLSLLSDETRAKLLQLPPAERQQLIERARQRFLESHPCRP